MSALKTGDTVKLKSGGEAKILSEFGAGGQGTVYKAEFEGKDYALKWYHPGAFKGKPDAAENFYKNLETNISNGPPTDAFLWPLAITEMRDGTFGYLMKVRPKGYEELTSFFVGTRKKPQVRFKSFAAISNAAINIIQGFRELHARGYSYQDINNGNFFIDPSDGKVLICDNDNVSPFGTSSGIMGKQRWMAPEIVTGGNPDTHSDRFSLAVVLFRLLFINHPLEGRYSSPPCMTKELEKKFYGTDPIFILDPMNKQNRPIPGSDANLKTFWPIYPQYIQDAFIRAFSQDVMMKKKPRLLETEWLDLFFRLRAETGPCPLCKRETFYSVTRDSFRCMECEKTVRRPALLKTKKFSLPVILGLKVYLWHLDSDRNDIETVIAEVVSNPEDPRVLGFKNVSGYTWKVDLPDGRQRPLPPGNGVPAKDGFVIDFINSSKHAGTVAF